MSERLDDILIAGCERFAQAPALEDEHEGLSYAALAGAARLVAAALRDHGIEPNEPVLVATANAPHDIAGFLGVWQAGGVVVPVSRSAPPAAIEATRAATGARLMVVGSDVKKVGDAAPPARELLIGAALVIFTSGSTGTPKGVVLGHDAFAGKLREIDSVLAFSPQTRALLVLQITFIYGIWFTLLTLLKGGRVWMCSRFDPPRLMSDLAGRGFNEAAFVPTMLRKLLASETALNSPLRSRIASIRIHTGGEPFNPALGERVREFFPGAAIVDIYGLTETASSNFFLLTAPGAAFAKGIGRCSRSERFRIADAQSGAVAAGEVGELQIATPFIMNGYLDRPDLTEAAFADGYFRTADLARQRPDGSVELVGRSKDLIVRGGAKVSPLELDGLLAQHPAVAAALSVGVPDEIAGERIHVLIVPRASSGVDEDELRQWVSARIEAFKRPDVYHFGSELPTGRTGKVDREALRRQLAMRNGRSV
jgi:acyl-CoA synthetase (AMP-forming)/AMP-acid ligase II